MEEKENSFSAAERGGDTTGMRVLVDGRWGWLDDINSPEPVSESSSIDQGPSFYEDRMQDSGGIKVIKKNEPKK